LRNVRINEFDDLVKTRTTAKDLSYVRLWTFDNEDQRQAMKEILEEQACAGLITGITEAALTDHSIIYKPRMPGTPRISCDSADQLEKELERFEPVCALEFATRGGRELERMVILSPEAKRFKELKFQFLKAWRGAKSVLATTAAAKSREG
jgi:hypothetical protein